METERTQLQMQVDRLRLQIEQQQQQLEAQENIIKQLSEFVMKEEKPQGTKTGKNPTGICQMWMGVLDLWRQGTLEKRMSKVEREPV